MSSLWNPRPPNTDKEFKAVIHRCNICDDMIHEAPEEVKKELKSMACVGISETFPSAGKTGYFIGKKYCSKCNRFMYSDNVFCLCCSGNLRSCPYDKREKEKRKA